MKNKIDNKLHDVANSIMEDKLPKSSWVGVILLTLIGTAFYIWMLAGILYFVFGIPGEYVLAIAITYNLWSCVKQFKFFKEGLKKSFLNKG